MWKGGKAFPSSQPWLRTYFETCAPFPLAGEQTPENLSQQWLRTWCWQRNASQTRSSSEQVDTALLDGDLNLLAKVVTYGAVSKASFVQSLPSFQEVVPWLLGGILQSWVHSEQFVHQTSE